MNRITATNLDNGGTGTSTSITTASISPAPNALIIVSVQTYDAGGSSPLIPTISGCGMTWVQIGTRQSSSDSHWRITLFRGMSASPTPGTLTISFGGSNNQTQYSVDQFTGVDASGTNGSGAIIQSAGNDNAGTNSGISVSLGAFQSPVNATFGAVIMSGVLSISPGVNFTQIGYKFSNGSIETEWAANNQTTVNWSWSSANESVVAMALEIKAFQPSGAALFPFLI